MEDIIAFSRVMLEEHVRLIGFEDLKWCLSDSSWWGEGIRDILYGKPKNYSGPYEDYVEPIVVEEVDNKKNHLLFRWIEK
ncbi:MAG: hypothetical protein WC494_00390 [Candidatus Pacearchaeota archaeon]